MTKKETIDYYKHIVGLVDQTDKYHPVVVEKAISAACNSVIYEAFKNRLLQNIDLYMKGYPSVAVLQDAVTKDWYITLPVTIMQLPILGDGVREITSPETHAVEFVPMSTDTAAMYPKLEASQVMNQIGYTVLLDRVVLTDLESRLGTTINSVNLRLVRPFEAYDDNETFYIPSGQDEKVDQLVLSKLGIIRPTGLKNDNNGGLK
jgi:hypothetical protein